MKKTVVVEIDIEDSSYNKIMENNPDAFDGHFMSRILKNCLYHIAGESQKWVKYDHFAIVSNAHFKDMLNKEYYVNIDAVVMRDKLHNKLKKIASIIEEK